jgi:hypothetical protein
MRRSIWLLAPCAALASCSGGSSPSGSVVISSPTSTPTPTPTPTPAPAGTLGTGEIKPAADATYISATMELTTTGGTSQTNGIITGGTTSARVITFDTPLFTGSYSSRTGYRLSDAVNAATFGPGQLALDTTTTNGNGTVLFTNVSGSIADYLALYQASTYTSSTKGMGPTTAHYGGSGGWQHTVSGHTRLDYFAFGSATPVGSMPRLGVVKFSILAAGNYATDTDLWFLPSSTSNFITVDFGTGTVTGSLSLSGENFFKNEVGGIGSMPIRGSVSGNAVTGPIVNASMGSSGSVPGQFHLVFVGPNADEIIMTYVAGDSTRAAVGAAVGIVDPFVF